MTGAQIIPIILYTMGSIIQMLSAGDSLVLRPLQVFQCYTLKKWEWPGKLVTLLIDFASPFLVSYVPTCACFFQCEPQAQMQLYEPCKRSILHETSLFLPHLLSPPTHTTNPLSYAKRAYLMCDLPGSFHVVFPYLLLPLIQS